MEAAITQDQIECLVCREMPIIVKETDWWGAIICQFWEPKLEKCPNRCNLTNNLILNNSKFVQRMINHIKVKWKYWNWEVERTQALEHLAECESSKLPSVVINPAMHSWCLYKKEKSKNWIWNGTKFIKHGWSNTGTMKKLNKSETSWSWEICKVHYWEDCIDHHSENFNKDDLKAFNDHNMHLSHQHILTLAYGEDLPDLARKNCYGKYKLGGWTSSKTTSLRYFAWFVCKVLLCEKWFQSDHNDYIKYVPTSVHKHILHLHWHPAKSYWECHSKKSKEWNKKDISSNIIMKIWFRCSLWDYNICWEWLKSSWGNQDLRTIQDLREEVPEGSIEASDYQSKSFVNLFLISIWRK